MKELESNEVKVYDKIDNVISLSLGYDVASVENRRQVCSTY